MTQRHWHTRIDSPVGKLTLIANDNNLVAVAWEHENIDAKKFASPAANAEHPVLCMAKAQLAEYFAGKRTEFSLPLKFEGTDFQKRVWRGLQQIPYGKTWSYGQLASAVGSPKAFRAVGAANARNPLSIVIPCHRVIGADGTLTGFGGGMNNKAVLLTLEGAHHA